MTPAGGIVTPLLQQAYQSDPRVALARMLQANAQSQENVPAYNPLSTLAKVLTQAVPGIVDYSVARDYQQRQANLGDTFKKALAAGQSGIPAQTDQSGNVTTPAVPGGYEALASVLANSTDPVAQQLGMQLGVQGLVTKQAAELALRQKLAEKNQTLDPNGQVIPMPGAPEAVRAINAAQAGGTAAGELPYVGPKAQAQAGGTAAGQLPYAGPLAAAAAAGKAPIEAFNEQFKPQVNRVTGAITIPGIENPEIVQKLMAAYGVSPKDLGVTAPPAAKAPPAAPLPAPGAPPAPSAPQPPAGAPSVAVPSPITPAAAPAGAQTAAPAGPVPAGTKKPIDEVPTVPLPTGEMPVGPGTVSPGRDPIKIKAAEGASDVATEQYKEIATSAKAAGQVRSQLGTMRATLNSGGINTNATAPARATLSAYLNAIVGPGVAQTVTGIDPAKADVFNKDATRMGLTFARQTEGAREAVAAIKIALGANPSLSNTTEGNRKIIDLLDAGVQHDLDAQKYANAYFQKNQHYVGAQEWFNQNHPPAEYTSKVIPYDLPRLQTGAVDPSKLQPNVTYMGKSGAGIWNGQGFLPVKQ